MDTLQPLPEETTEPAGEAEADVPSLTPNPVAEMLRRNQRGRYSRWAILAAVVIAVGLGLYFWLTKPTPPPEWTVEKVDRGDLVTSVTTTGSLEPRRTIVVGAEVSGRIATVEVDENDRVKEGQVLARFDTELLEAALKQAEAALAVARAAVTKARATRDESKATEKRVKMLENRRNVTTNEVEQAVAARKRAAAELVSAKAQVKQAEARYDQARSDLERAVIKSPVDGVVLVRSVEPGNTVAASLQSPELFTLAEDLSEMTLELEVDEADVSLVQPGQSAAFTVDAWPEREFEARVQSIRLYPTTEENVVTYETTLTVDNSEGLLRPGMTATATITTATYDDVLRVPNSALQFTPPQTSEGGVSIFPHPRRRGGNGEGPTNTVWVLRGSEPVKVPLRLGYTDGRFTEVRGGEIAEGDEVVVGMKAQEEGQVGGKR